MRIAVLILGLLLGLLMFIQTVLVGTLSSAAGNEANTQAGAVGFFVAILWLVACAFVLPFPLVSVIGFAVAALFSFGAAATSDYRDMYVWGTVGLILMLLSFVGWRGKVKDRKAKAAERTTQVERDARYEALLMAQQSQDTSCPACGQLNPVGVRFCGNCGTKLTGFGSQPGSA